MGGFWYGKAHLIFLSGSGSTEYGMKSHHLSGLKAESHWYVKRSSLNFWSSEIRLLVVLVLKLGTMPPCLERNCAMKFYVNNNTQCDFGKAKEGWQSVMPEWNGNKQLWGRNLEMLDLIQAYFRSLECLSFPEWLEIRDMETTGVVWTNYLNRCLCFPGKGIDIQLWLGNWKCGGDQEEPDVNEVSTNFERWISIPYEYPVGSWYMSAKWYFWSSNNGSFAYVEKVKCKWYVLIWF